MAGYGPNFYRKNRTITQRSIAGQMLDQRAIRGELDDDEIMDLVRARFRLALKEAYSESNDDILGALLRPDLSDDQKADVYKRALRVYRHYGVESELPKSKRYLAKMIGNIFDKFGWSACGPYETAELPSEEYYPAITRW